MYRKGWTTVFICIVGWIGGLVGMYGLPVGRADNPPEKASDVLVITTTDDEVAAQKTADFLRAHQIDVMDVKGSIVLVNYSGFKYVLQLITYNNYPDKIIIAALYEYDPENLTALSSLICEINDKEYINANMEPKLGMVRFNYWVTFDDEITLTEVLKGMRFLRDKSKQIIDEYELERYLQ